MKGHAKFSPVLIKNPHISNSYNTEISKPLCKTNTIGSHIIHCISCVVVYLAMFRPQSYRPLTSLSLWLEAGQQVGPDTATRIRATNILINSLGTRAPSMCA